VEEQLLNVFIYSENVYGTIKKMGAFASMVTYKKNGYLYEELIENEDLKVIE